LRIDGVLELADVGLLGISLSLGAAHGFGDHRSCNFHYVTLRACSGGTHIISAVILDRLRCAARDNAQCDELV
jgi:hypothetical protein